MRRFTVALLVLLILTLVADIILRLAQPARPSNSTVTGIPLISSWIDIVLAVEFGIPVVAELYSRFLIRPKLNIHAPFSDPHQFPFRRKRKVVMLDVCTIVVEVDNFEGQSSAEEVEMIISAYSEKEGRSPGSAVGWIAAYGERRLRKRVHEKPFDFEGGDCHTLHMMADGIYDCLLQDAASIPHTGARFAVSGYAIKGLQNVLLGEHCVKLPLKDYTVEIEVHNPEHGTLDTKTYTLNWSTWNKPKFTHPRD